MIVRGLNSDGDWLFGKGQNDYRRGVDAIAQSIQTRVLSFLGDCFFAVNDGIDWFNLLGAKDQLSLELSVRAMILNTNGVTSLINSSVSVDSGTRVISMSYSVNTIYTRQGVEVPVSQESSFLLTEDGFLILTEDGTALGAG